MIYKKKNAIFIAVLLIVCTVFYFVRGSDNIVLSVDKKSLTIRGPEDTVFAVDFNDIQSVKLVESPEYGVGGRTKYDFAYGTWKNDAWGSYNLCVNTKIKACIVITAKDSIYAFNYTDLDTTRNFYTSFLKYLAEETS